MMQQIRSIYYSVSFFFFSSRRRHTRYWRDWSSDVCSSDLFEGDFGDEKIHGFHTEPGAAAGGGRAGRLGADALALRAQVADGGDHRGGRARRERERVG